ncbi:MAG TPA: hypothetical protein PKN54_11195 [Candidatus Cloacimonas acidaminovorans]|nr:hypothetical protein [Candidatus Cloacimonas acidaminovorans]
MINTIEINGYKRSGINVASKTIPLQFEYLIQEYNRISNCFKATINIQLDYDLIVLNPDYRSKPLKWNKTIPEEVFDFLSVKLFIPRLNIEYSAWLYIPHNSPHRNRQNIHEVLCEKIENLNECENLKLRIVKQFVILPYEKNKIYII